MTISVLQWNIWSYEDIRKTVMFLKECPVDVACLQELTIGHPSQTVKDTSAFLAQQLDCHYYCQKIPIEATDGRKLMLANGIFSRFPITKQRFVWTNEPKYGGGYDDEYRAYVEVTLDVKGRFVTVGTTHMSYTHRFQETPNKNAEADKLAQELSRHSEHFIFTGDLNALPGSYTLKRVNQILHHAGPDFNQKTWATKPFSYQGFEESELNWRLDYIFITPDLKVESSEILTTDFSDHLPILTKLSLN